MHSLNEHFFTDALLDAVRQMQKSGAFDVESLLPLYLKQETMLHSQKEGAPDLTTLASLVNFGGINLFEPFVVERGVLFEPPSFKTREGAVFFRTPGSNYLYSALALRLAAFVELEKFRKVAAHIDDEASKLQTLQALWNLDADALNGALGDFRSAFLQLCSKPKNGMLLCAKTDTPSVDDSFFDIFLNDAPSIVCAGAVAALYNRLSPYVARHREKLQALDSDEYRAVSLVAAQDPLSIDERFDVETRDGITRSGDVILIRTEALDIHSVDVQLQPLIKSLAATQTRLVLTDEPERFFSLISRYPKVQKLAFFFEGTLSIELSGVLSRGSYLAMPRRSNTGADVALSVPTLGVAPNDTPCVEYAAPFINALHRAYLTGDCRAQAFAGAFQQGDESAATQMCVQAFSDLLAT